MTTSRKTAGRLLGAALIAVVSAGCATVGPAVLAPGPQTTQARAVTAVAAVDLASSGDLILTHGAAPSLHITAGRNVIDHLTSHIDGDRLTLGTDGSLHSIGPVRYDLVLPAARVVELSGSGAVRVAAASALQQLVLSGSGEVRVDGLQTASLSVDLSGSGELVVAGRSQRQRVSIGGSGDYSAGGLASEVAEVTISGSGNADVAVSSTLTATVSGSGSITYSGNPAVTRSVTGSGTVMRR